MSEETVINPETVIDEQPKEPAKTEVAAEPAKKYHLVRYTLDGEVLVETDGKGEPIQEFPLKTVGLLPLPPAFKEAHMIELKLFHSLLLTIKKSYPNRQVPITKKEYLRSGASTKLLNQLLDFALLKQTLVPLLSTSGKNPGSRSCLYYTPQGRALIRSRLDPEYAKTEYS